MNLNCANDVSGNKSECTHVHVQHTLSAKLGVGERVPSLFNKREGKYSSVKSEAR